MIAKLPDIIPPITSPMMKIITRQQAIPSFRLAPDELLECPKSFTTFQE